jgi:thiamine pyrophosphate-dependent acetolactate synthase large subunit-like protein
MARMTAGRAIVEMLRAEDVTHVFGIVGTTTNSIVTELHGRKDISFVDTRHEEGAAFMAYGYARASGKPAVCVTTSGPGSTNLITGMALAYKGRAPVIAIGGDVARDYIDRDGAQAFDLVSIFKPVTYMSRQLYKTERIPELMHDAFRAALAAKRGPVFLSMPRDLLDKQSLECEVLEPESYRPVNARPQADCDAVRKAAELLAGAHRPLLLAGGGVIDSEATQEAVELAELLEMALVSVYGHNDALPNSHRLYIASPGNRGASEAAHAIHAADVILALGTRINQASTQWNFSTINPATRIIQVDIDPQEVGRNYPLAAGLVGDAKAVTRQLLDVLRARSGKSPAKSAWLAEIARLREARHARLEAEHKLTGDPMMPQRVYPELRKVLPRDCMVTVDAGVAAGLVYDRLAFDVPRTFFNYAGHGGLGMGYCVGLGTKLGRPERAAITLQGDGGFMYTTGEINTAVRWKIPHVSIVLNNRCHGAEKAQQLRNFDAKFIGVDLDNPRFDKLAEACGAKGFYVTQPGDVAEAVKAALAVDGPAVVEIPVAEHFPQPSQRTGAAGSH